MAPGNCAHALRPGRLRKLALAKSQLLVHFDLQVIKLHMRPAIGIRYIRQPAAVR